jgi:hypothetical protein
VVCGPDPSPYYHPCCHGESPRCIELIRGGKGFGLNYKSSHPPTNRSVSVSAALELVPFSGGPNETHVSSGPAVKERTGTRTEPGPTHRRGPYSFGKCQLQWRVTHYVRLRSQEDQPGAESAMGEAEGSPAEGDDLSGRP